MCDLKNIIFVIERINFLNQKSCNFRPCHRVAVVVKFLNKMKIKLKWWWFTLELVPHYFCEWQKSCFLSPPLNDPTSQSKKSMTVMNIDWETSEIERDEEKEENNK